ncbi:MAG: HepT-like ribonuclease domain-containing protein [Phycisphaerales bacterium]
MIDAGRQIAAFIAGRTRADLDSDPMLARALMHAVMEIGEAAARLSDVGRSKANDIPWGQIVAMRHILVHVYWGVDFDRLWRTAVDEVPALVRRLDAAVTDWPLPGSNPDL